MLIKKKEEANRINIPGVKNKKHQTQIDFKSLERSHDDLYPSNRFGIDLDIFACVHMNRLELVPNRFETLM